MLRHNFANARVLRNNYALEVVVFQALFELAGAGLGIHRQHVKMRDLRKQRLLRSRHIPRVLRNGVPPEKHQVLVYARIAHRAKQAHFLGLGRTFMLNFIRGGTTAEGTLILILILIPFRRLKRQHCLIRGAALRLKGVVRV